MLSGKSPVSRNRDLIDAAQRQCDGLPPEQHHTTTRRDAELAAAAPTFSPQPGRDDIPGYELLGERHRGGQGVVYEAVQRATKRRVAIKMLLQSADQSTAAQRLRFEREVEILSHIRHPHVVTVHDSGVADGRLYYVMDLIDGMRLDRWVAGLWPEAEARGDDSLVVTQVLRLFAKICDAVNVAHLRGVIHRDLKPGNILIDRAGEPHVLDFGLAKFTLGLGDDPSEMPTMTQEGQFIGSLPWASPEQAGGAVDQIDSRTDVYALGVLLYQALTGRFPYSITGSVGQIIEQIRSAAPTPMNSPWVDVQGAQSFAGKLEVDGELETIVLKTLQKDPERRYQNAGELGRDLTRYLNHEPIEAKRDSLAYVLRKQLRRHRLAAAAISAVALACVAGLIVSLVFWGKAETQRIAAQHETQRAQAAEREAVRKRQLAETATRLLKGMFGAAEGERFRGKDVTVQEMLDLHAEQIARKAAGQPDLEATLCGTIGDAYMNLGAFDRAEPHILRGVELMRQTYGENHPEYAGGLNDRAILYQNLAKYDQAEADYRRSIEICAGEDEKTVDVRLVAQHGLANLLSQTGRHAQAEPLLRAGIETARGKPALRSKLAGFLRTLAAVLNSSDRDTEAEPLYVESIAMLIGEFGEDHPNVAAARNDYAILLDFSGRHEPAIELYEKSLPVLRRAYGEETPRTVIGLGNLGVAYLHARRFDRARELLTEARTLAAAVFPEGHPGIATAANNLASFQEKTGETDAAVDGYRECLQILEGAFPPMHPHILGVRLSLVRVLTERGRPDDLSEAEKLLSANIETQRKRLPDSEPDLANLLAQLGNTRLRQERWSDAEAALAEAIEIRTRLLPAGHWLAANSRSMLGEAILRQGRLGEAESLLTTSFELINAARDAPPARLRDACERVVRLYETRGDEAASREWRKKLAELK